MFRTNCFRSILKEEKKIDRIPPLLQRDFRLLKEIEKSRFAQTVAVSDIGSFFYLRELLGPKRVFLSEILDSEDVVRFISPKYDIVMYLKEYYQAKTKRRFLSRKYKFINYTPNCIYEKLYGGCVYPSCKRIVKKYVDEKGFEFFFYQKLWFMKDIESSSKSSKPNQTRKLFDLELRKLKLDQTWPRQPLTSINQAVIGLASLSMLYEIIFSLSEDELSRIKAFFLAYNPKRFIRIVRRHNQKMFFDQKDLLEAKDLIESLDKTLIIVLNERPFSKTAYSFQEEIVKELFKKFNVHHFILANPYLMKKFRNDISIKISCLMPLLNERAIEFAIEEFRPDRIVLSRKLSESECFELIDKFDQIGFEIFSESEIGCSFFEGYCRAGHIFESSYESKLFTPNYLCYRCFSRNFRWLMRQRKDTSRLTKTVLSESRFRKSMNDGLERVVFKYATRLLFENEKTQSFKILLT